MIKLKFLRGCVVSVGVTAKAGDVLDVPANIAADLIGLRRAVVAPAEDPVQIETREPHVEARDPAIETPVKRLYSRRPPK